MIPTNGGEHNANQARQATYLGYGIGKWEGDTLVRRLDFFRRFDMAGTWWPIPLRRHADRREVHAYGQ